MVLDLFLGFVVDLFLGGNSTMGTNLKTGIFSRPYLSHLDNLFLIRP